jgi:hypothetical protein
MDLYNTRKLKENQELSKSNDMNQLLAHNFDQRVNVYDTLTKSDYKMCVLVLGSRITEFSK